MTVEREQRIFGPGDDEGIRLLLSSEVQVSSVMDVVSGDVQQVVYLDLETRTLANRDEREKRSVAMSFTQATLLVHEIVDAVLKAEK